MLSRLLTRCRSLDTARKPGAWEYGSEDDADDDRDVSHNNNDDDDDDGDEDDGDEPELLISSVLVSYHNIC